MAIDESEVRRRIDGVVAAMKAVGIWDVAEPSAEAIAAGGAFGGDTMSFEQWLRHVFVPSIETRLRENGPWPSSSAVSPRATREADGVPELDPVVDALRDFDELFAEETAATLYARARSLHAEGRTEEAIVAAEAAIARAASYPNAHNYAGWLLWKKPAADAASRERALLHFAHAMTVAKTDVAPVANYGDVLLELGRDDEAFRWMTERTLDPPVAANAHNWLGWWKLRRGDAAAAVNHLRQAVSLRPTWDNARVNLGEALERNGMADEAYDVLDPRRTRYEDANHRAFAYERRAAYEARKGWLQSALASMRRAVVACEIAHRPRLEECREGERYVAAMLHAHAIWAPTFELERRWIAGSERERPPRRRAVLASLEALGPLDESPYAALAKDLLGHVEGRAMQRRIDAEVFAKAIDDPNLGQAFRLADRWLAAAWTRSGTVEVPPERTMRDEHGSTLAPALLAVERLARAGAWADAATALEAQHAHAIDAIDLAERAGDDASDAGLDDVARRLYVVALAGARLFAAGATSGGEGMARMEDVHRLEAKAR
ncbi:hypothetical protein BH09MYX1_BH09MYX1_10150 [soil metagenome]